MCDHCLAGGIGILTAERFNDLQMLLVRLRERISLVADAIAYELYEIVEPFDLAGQHVVAAALGDRAVQLHVELMAMFAASSGAGPSHLGGQPVQLGKVRGSQPATRQFRGQAFEHSRIW